MPDEPQKSSMNRKWTAKRIIFLLILWSKWTAKRILVLLYYLKKEWKKN